MRLDAVEWKKTQLFAEDYLKNLPSVSGRFDFLPWDKTEWKRRADWLDGFDAGRPSRADRAGLIDALQRFNEHIQNAPEALRAVHRLADPATLAVVGGQQAGLFTGPLMVVYKAVSLIGAAKQAENLLGRPVVPVFWIAGEDHDFDEVNHWYTLTPQLEIDKWKLPHPTGVRTSVSRLPIESWGEALEHMDAVLPQSEFKTELMDRLRGFSEASSTLTVFFARVMAWLFGRHGLILMDSDDPALRALEAPMFERLIADSGVLNRAFLEGKSAVEKLGYQPQADVSGNGVNLFLFDENEERKLLHQEEGLIADKRGTLTYTPEQLAELARTNPSRFSNNVLTRPLMQEFLFPVLGTVLGPGEIGYWGLLREAFHTVGFRMPVVFPRLEFTLLEGTVQKHLEKYALTFSDVLEHFEEKKAVWLREQDQLGLEGTFTETKRTFADLYEPVVQKVGTINPGLRKLGETNLKKILDQIDFLHARAAEAQESQFASALRHWERIRLTLAPYSKPQERVYNVFAYLNKYGTDWLDELLQLSLEPDGKHRLIYF